MDDYFAQLNALDTSLKSSENESTSNKGSDCCGDQTNQIIESGGIYICKVCNKTVNNIIMNPEWRYYGANDTRSSDPTRCGMPANILLPKSSLGSTVSYKGSRSKTMYQVRKYQQWNGMPYKERSAYRVFLEIAEICSSNNIPTIIIEEAKGLYKIVSETKISRGANRKGIIAACVYFACKLNNVPRSSKEIAAMFSINNTIITRGCKKFQEILHMNKEYKHRLSNMEIVNAGDLIERYSSQLNLDTKYIQEIKGLCTISINLNIISENTPPSIAGGCIYYIINKYNLNISKKELSKICKISEVTINKCYKRLTENIKD